MFGAATTLAVNVTDVRFFAGLRELDTAVVLAAFETFSVTEAGPLCRLALSPLYVAVIVWAPTESNDVVNAACRPFTGTVARTTPASANVTVPVTVAAPFT